MAEVLNRGGRWWALDKLFLSYLLAIGALIAGFWNQIPQAGGLMALHAAGAAIILMAVKFPGRVSGCIPPFYVIP